MEGSNFINIGDEIVLFSIEQDEGFIASGGLSEDRCVVRSQKDKESAFKIYPMITYTSTKPLKRRIKRTRQQGEFDQAELNKQIETLQELEHSTNETFLSQLEGKPLVYGQIIQLLHLRTSKWMAGKHRDDSTQLRLEKSGSQRCWFKLMCQDKTVKEGARVVVNAVVKLVHLSSGCFVHQDSWAEDDGAFPLETSTMETSWQIRHFEAGGGRLRGLKHGDAVRFFHQEAGYLSGNRNNEVKCKYKPSSSVPTSYNTIWSVEQVTPNNEEVGWGQLVRFKILTSGMYLKMSEVGEDENRSLTLAKDPYHPNCNFSFVSPKKDTERITTASSILIQTQSKSWVHCADELFGIDHGAKTARLTEVTCSKTFNYDDAFHIKPAPPSQIEKFLFVEDRLPVIKDYLNKIRVKAQKSQDDQQVEETLAELIRACTNSDDENALTREGQAIKAHQSLLNSPDFLEELCELCELSATTDERICRLSIRLLKQISKDNIKNGCLIQRFSSIFLTSTQVLKYFELGAADLYNEVYRNNKTPLEVISREQIRIIINILEQTHSHQLLHFLSVLCQCDDEPLPTNQKLIALELFERDRPIDEILIRTKFKSDTEVLVEYHGETQTVDKFTLKENLPEVHYFEQQLVLYSTLCKGRNYTGIQYVTKIISFREAFSCLKNEFMLPKFRSCYSNILLNVFVDCYPYSRNYSEFTLIWPLEPRANNLSSPQGQTRESSHPTSSSHNIGAITAHGPSSSPISGSSSVTAIHTQVLSAKKKREIPTLAQIKNPKNLQEFLISYISSIYSFRFDRRQQQIGQPTFFYDVFVLLRYSILFGFFKSKEAGLFPRFKELLEVHPDYTHQNEPRNLPEHYQKVLLGVKYHVCKIVEAFMDIQLNTVFAEFVQNFPTEHLSDFSELSVKKAMLTNLQETLDTAEISDDDDFGLCGSLLQLLKHENDQLSSAALNVLVRILRSQSREAELLLFVPSAQLLTNPQDRESYKNYQDKYDKMKKLTAEKMSSAQKDEVNGLIQFFIHDCGTEQKINSNNQRTFANLGLYEGIFNILKLPMEVENEFDTDLKGMTEIFLSCYHFLRMFSFSNPTNQKFMFKYVSFMIDQMVRYRTLAVVILDTIVEVFKDNTELCSEITSKMVEPFVRLISEKERRIDYLTFFKIIVAPQNHLLKANQNLVLEMLMREKIDDIMISTTSLVDLDPITPRPKDKEKLVSSDPGISSPLPVSQEDLEHHLKFISLLALCAEGKIYEAEITCQKLFSVEDCLTVLSSHPEFQIRSAYLHFLDEVYLNTETTMQIHPSVILLATSDKMWKLIESLATEVVEFTTDPEAHSPEHLYHEYVLKNILSFFRSYYAKCFVLKKATQQQIGLTNTILERLITLYRTLEERRERKLYYLVSCIKVLHDLGVVCGLSQEVAKILEETDMILQGLKDQDDPNVTTLSVGKATSGELEQEIMARIYNSIVYLMKTEEEQTQFLEIFVTQIRNTENRDLSLKIHSLRTISAMVKLTKNRSEFQKRIANLEAPLFILDLLDSKDPTLIEEALATVMLLIDTGNENTPEPNTYVTETIMNSFTSRGDEHFFQDLYNIFQTSKGQLKERKAKLLAKKKSQTIMKKRLGVDVNNPLDRQTLSEAKGAKPGVLLRMLNHTGEEEDGDDDASSSDKQTDKNRFHIEKHYPHMLKVFRLLQLVSKGSGPPFKDYCRIQEDNYQSFDLVRETVQYLKVLESLIGSEDNFELAIQCFTTLREFALGSPLNCEAIINAQILTPINRTLINNFVESQNPTRPIDLKIEAVELLIAIATQTENSDIINKIIANLDFEGIEAGTKPVSEINCTGNQITYASACYRFIKGLSELDSSDNPKVIKCLVQCEDHCKSRIGRIEIVVEKQLKRLYFPIPAAFRRFVGDRLRDEESRVQAERILKEELESDLAKQKIDWKKGSEKVRGFANWCEMVLVTKEHDKTLATKPWAKFLVQKEGIWRLISFFLAVVINFLIVIFGDDSTLGFQDRQSWLMKPLQTLGALQTFTAFFVVVSYFLRDGLIVHFRGWKHIYDRQKCYMLHSISERINTIKDQVKPWYRYWAQSALDYLTDGMSLFYIFYMMLSIIGNAVSPLFFVYHLFLMTVRSRNLGIVFQALSITKTPVLLLFVLIFQVVYVFSIISFSLFQKHYSLYQDAYFSTCNSVVECFTSNVYYGIPSASQILQMISPYVWGGTEPWTQTLGWIVWIVFFYILVGIILLNVVFAVIVDTFGQLRDKRQQMKEELNRSCLICSIDREKFQRKGKDFQKHLDDDHNPCQYLYFFAFLKEKKEKGQDHQLTTDEKYVEGKINQNGFLDFLPIDRALVLEGDEDEEDVVKIFKKLDEMEQQTNRISKELHSAQKEATQISHQILTTSEEMRKFRTRVEKGKQQNK